MRALPVKVHVVTAVGPERGEREAPEKSPTGAFDSSAALPAPGKTVNRTASRRDARPTKKFRGCPTQRGFRWVGFSRAHRPTPFVCHSERSEESAFAPTRPQPRACPERSRGAKASGVHENSNRVVQSETSSQIADSKYFRGKFFGIKILPGSEQITTV
jgi:hypothetical protein